MSKWRSPVWQLFIVAGDFQENGKCNKCNANAPQYGTSAKSYTTSNLISHNRSKRRDLCKEHSGWKATDKEERDEVRMTSCSYTSSGQLSLKESTNHICTWTTNDARTLWVICRICEMIIIDCQPLSIASDTEFLCIVSKEVVFWSLTLESRNLISKHRVWR